MRKSLRMRTYTKRGRGVPPQMSLARKGYPQDAPFALKQSGASRRNEVGGEEHLRPKADPSAKIRPRDDSLGAGLSKAASARGGEDAGLKTPALR
jgi:hypothetical protein